MDCSNGVNSVSIKKYQFLHQYFQLIIVNNTAFDQPNVDCGAEWIYHHRQDLKIDHLPKAQHYAWFDGDADRIIMK